MSRKQQCNSLVRSSLVTLTTVAAALFALAAGEAEAQAQTRFGDKGQLAITAENLFTLSSARTAEAAGPFGDVIITSNRFGLLLSNDRDVLSVRAPQVGGHYFIIPNLSIGATLGYDSWGGNTTSAPNPNGVTVTQSRGDASTFVFMPKVGYALMLGDTIGFWFRGGPGFFHYGENGADTRFKDGVTFWLLSLEALFVVNPVPHFGFFVGPQADISFAGTHTRTDNIGPGGAFVEASQNISYRAISIGAGLMGYFDL